MKNIKTFTQINEAKAKVSLPKDLQMISSDYKDIEGFIKEMKTALKTFGINVYANPAMEGSDTYSFFLTKEKLTTKQLDSTEIYKRW